MDKRVDVAVIGAGSVGISVAYYLKSFKPSLSVLLIDSELPMSLTSSVSGENYRNWWPHPVMKAFMDRSIQLMEKFHQQYGNVIQSRSGYLLASRDPDPDALIDNLKSTFAEQDVRFRRNAEDYSDALSVFDDGVEILQTQQHIQQAYPGFDNSLETMVHIRCGGSISAHDLGVGQTGCFRQAGGSILQASVVGIEKNNSFIINTESSGSVSIVADAVVNAAGPYAQNISQMAGVSLPVNNVLQQKIAFADTAGAVSREQPFLIDLDAQTIDWNSQEREAIEEDSAISFLTQEIPGSIHCRPDGGMNSNRIKLGWAYNTKNSTAIRQPALDDHFPEVVLRGAARINPALKVYYEKFPRDFIHYGGYYTYIAAAMSGFGTMAACAAGELTALWVLGRELPGYAKALSMQRYSDAALMNEIAELQSRGIL